MNLKTYHFIYHIYHKILNFSSENEKNKKIHEAELIGINRPFLLLQLSLQLSCYNLVMFFVYVFCVPGSLKLYTSVEILFGH